MQSHRRAGGSLVLALMLIGCQAPPPPAEEAPADVESQSTATLERKPQPPSNTSALEGCPAEPPCSFSPRSQGSTPQRFALVVGVGDYEHPQVPDLAGAPLDACRIYDLLTAEKGYGFSRENVCLLIDRDATTQRFREAFEKALIDRAREGDEALFYFAGHGSQRPDTNGDEPDTKDETFLFHDSRMRGQSDLADDELNGLLARLRGKTSNITVLVDSCNSGTATRGLSTPGDDPSSRAVSRFAVPDPNAPTGSDSEAGDGGDGWAPDGLEDVVFFSAATDGTEAKEVDGRGVFTDALLAVLSEVGREPLTYRQVARLVPPLVSAESYQIPYFQGPLDRVVFDQKTRTVPYSWEVISAGPPVQLGGPPLPGIGEGAELRIFDGGVSGPDARDPAKAKATVVIDSTTGLEATAHVSASGPASGEIQGGDLAILARPGDDAARLRVRLSSSVDSDRGRSVREALAKNDDTKDAIIITEGSDFDFEVAQDASDRLILRDSSGRLRTTYEKDRAVAENLWQHARQRALLQLRGEGGSDFVDGETLQVQIVSAAKQSRCNTGSLRPAEPNSEQVLPICHEWNIKVTVAEDAPTRLLVGGVILSADGGIFGFPATGSQPIGPGESHVFNDPDYETFTASPPLDVQDHIVVFGTKEDSPVQWGAVTDPAVVRSDAVESTLSQAITAYLNPGTRGVKRSQNAEADTWTRSAMTIRVVANRGFGPRVAGRSAGKATWREYTEPSFDIRPYLPDDPEAKLARLLTVADGLANSSKTDGISYKQHDWSQGDDEANLSRGIDCSRAVWYAYTRAGLRYTDQERYLPTKQMVGDRSPLSNAFRDCTNDPDLQIGDILVYRDKGRGDGHTLLVIDAEKRVGWGSHGWDGNPKKFDIPPDTGVEYQRIRFKKDWQRWDRSTMRLASCWRSEELLSERQSGRGVAGGKAVADACDARQQCGQAP